MKNESAILEKCFRADEHKALIIRMLGEGENIHFEIMQIFSNEIIPADKQETIKIVGSNLMIGLSRGEFFAIIDAGLDFFRLIKK